MNPAQIHTDKQPLPKLAGGTVGSACQIEALPRYAQLALDRLLAQYKPIEEKAA